MAAGYNRDITVTWDGAQLLGCTEKSLSIGGEPVDISSDEDNGYRTLMAEDATRSVDYSISGIDKDAVFRRAKASGDVRAPVVVTYANGDELSFSGHLMSFEGGGASNEAETFSVSIQSSGTYTYTVGP